MRSLLYYVVMTAFTLVFFLFVTLVFLLTVPFDRERRVLHIVSRWWGLAIFGLCPWWKLKLEGAENYKHEGPFAVLTNHNSMVDIPIMYVLRIYFKWVAKKEVYRWPLFGQVLWMHGDIAIERGTASGFRKMTRQAKEHLNRGTSVIIFPEGTRSRDGRIGRFREGAFMMAKEAGVPVLPCVIDGTRNMITGWKLTIPHTFTVKVLPAVSAEDVKNKTIAELTELVHGRMMEAHIAMRPDLYKKEGVKK